MLSLSILNYQLSINLQVLWTTCVPYIGGRLRFGAIRSMGLGIIWLLFIFGSMFGFSESSFAQVAGSPVIDEVIFKDGVYEKSGVVSVPRRCPVNGPTECGNTSSMSVYVKGKKGDRITVSLTSRTGKAVFTVFSPDREPLENGSSTTAWSGTLPSDGNYLIPVYIREGKGSTPFTLKILDH